MAFEMLHPDFVAFGNRLTLEIFVRPDKFHKQVNALNSRHQVHGYLDDDQVLFMSPSRGNFPGQFMALSQYLEYMQNLQFVVICMEGPQIGNGQSSTETEMHVLRFFQCFELAAALTMQKELSKLIGQETNCSTRSHSIYLPTVLL